MGISSPPLASVCKFSAYRNGAWTDPVSPADVIFDTTLFDTGSNFNVSTGVFTAPVAGFYQFDGAVTVGTSNGGNNLLSIYLYQGASNIVSHTQTSPAVSTNLTARFSKLVQCAASDAMKIQSANSISVGALSGIIYTYFTGYLVSLV